MKLDLLINFKPFKAKLMTQTITYRDFTSGVPIFFLNSFVPVYKRLI